MITDVNQIFSLIVALQNLGLGVLEHQDHEMSDTTSSSESSDGDEFGSDGKKNVMAKLMGQSGIQEKAGIEEMDIH